MQTQDSNNKNSFSCKKLKPKDLKPALLYDNAAAELAKKKDTKDKKKRFQEQKWEYTEEQKKQTLATNDNITEVA